MSAQAVLSLIAPAIPAAPQGPTNGGASGFQGLLDTLLSADGTSGDIPATPAIIREESADPASATAGFLIAPLAGVAPVPAVAAPVPPVPTTASASPVEGAEQPPATPSPSKAGVLADTAVPLAPTTATDTKAPVALPQGETPVTDEFALAPEPSTPPAPANSVDPEVSKAVTPPISSTTPSPALLPSAPAQSASSPAASRIAATPAFAPPVEDATGKGVAPSAPVTPAQPVITPSASGKTPDAPDTKPAANDAAPVPADGATKPSVEVERDAARIPKSSLTPATPAPLRSPEDRLAKPLDAAPAARESAPHSEVGAPATIANPASVPDGVAQPAKAAAAAPVVAEAGAALPEPSAEPAPLSDTPAASTQASGPERDHGLSTLSRASIDATAQIAAQILRKLEGRSTRFEIALRPDELGRVDVKLDIDSDGRLAARLAFDNPAAATDLRGRTDELRRQLEAAGFQLADDAFEFAERDSGSSGFDRGQDARQGQSRAFAAAARLNADTDITQPPQWLALSLSPSGVDMKV